MKAFINDINLNYNEMKDLYIHLNTNKLLNTEINIIMKEIDSITISFRLQSN